MLLINGRFLMRRITGVERVSYNLLKCLIKHMEEDQIRIVIPTNVQIQDVYEDIPQKYIIRFGKLHSKLGKLAGHLWEQWYLPKIQKQLQASRNDDVFLVNFANTAPLFAKNLIVMIHDLAFKEVPQTFNKWFVLYYNFLIPRLVKKAKLVLTVSYFSKKKLVELYKADPHKIFVIYQGLKRFFNNPVSIEEKIRLWKNTDQEKYITFHGSLSDRKNVNGLIKGFILAKNKRPDIFHNIKLLIIGKASKIFSFKLDSRAEQRDDIILAGYVPDDQLKKYLNKTILGAHLAFYEGFNLVPGEYMLMNIPYLASDIPINREVYKEFVAYVDPNNINAIANKLIEILDNYPEFAGNLRNAFKYLNSLTWDNTCNSLLKVLQKHEVITKSDLKRR